MNIQIYAEVSRTKPLWIAKLLHRVVSVEGNHRRSLVQPLVQVRVSCEIRPGCSVLFPFGSWKLQRQRLQSLSGQPAPLPGWDSGWKSVSLYLFCPSLVSAHACCLSSSQPGVLCRAQLHLLPAGRCFPCWGSALLHVQLAVLHSPSCGAAPQAPSLCHSSKLVHPRSRKVYLVFNFKAFLLAQSSSLPRSQECFQAQRIHSPGLFHLQT